jgi:hypothetical protein
MDGWRRLAEGSDQLRFMVIYLPIPKLMSKVERQRDPYQAFAIGGSELASLIRSVRSTISSRSTAVNWQGNLPERGSTSLHCSGTAPKWPRLPANGFHGTTETPCLYKNN